MESRGSINNQIFKIRVGRIRGLRSPRRKEPRPPPLVRPTVVLRRG
jgi:hypothetical protein